MDGIVVGADGGGSHRHLTAQRILMVVAVTQTRHSTEDADGDGSDRHATAQRMLTVMAVTDIQQH